MIPELIPDWPAPVAVKSFFTTRMGGFSRAPYESLNLALHVDDDPQIVQRNRRLLPVPGDPLWLNQVHSDTCIDASRVVPMAAPAQADASFTREAGRVLVVMVADCLPVLLASTDGSVIAVAHAGWRGLANGVIESTLTSIGGGDMMAWLGPAIGPCHYVVGAEVRHCFPEQTGFAAMPDGQFAMDLYSIARQQLEALGVACFGGGYCTYCDEAQFFSYRRDGVTGRMAGLIWMQR